MWVMDESVQAKPSFIIILHHGDTCYLDQGICIILNINNQYAAFIHSIDVHHLIEICKRPQNKSRHQHCGKLMTNDLCGWLLLSS